MIRLVLTTVLVATWLLQSCAGEDNDPFQADAGCTATSAPAKPVPPGTTIRVGVTGALGEAGQYLAQEEGYFTREGLRVQLINFAAASRMVPAISAGQLDVGSVNVGPGLFTASENSLCVKVVAPLGREEPNANGMFLFLRQEFVEGGHVQGYNDLRGLHIAVPGRDSSSEYTLSKLLNAGGLSLNDVRLVQMSYPMMLVSLANKSIDAALLPEGLASSAASKSLGVKWKPVAEAAPGVQSGVVLFSPRFATQRDVGVRWMTAYLQAARDYDDAFFRNIRRDEIVDHLVKASPLKDARLFDEMSFPLIDPDGKLNLDSIGDQMAWFVQAGRLREPADLSRVVDASFAESAVQRLGPYQ